jgi:hypothetical protein
VQPLEVTVTLFFFLKESDNYTVHAHNPNGSEPSWKEGNLAGHRVFPKAGWSRIFSMVLLAWEEESVLGYQEPDLK